MPDYGILKRASFGFLALAVAVVLVLAVALIFYSLPMADDFCRAAKADAVDHLRNIYQYWSGRWFSIGLGVVLLSRISLTDIYPLLMAILFCLAYIGWLMAVLTIFRGRLPIATAVAGSFVLFAYFWATIPSPGETFYWASGAFENLLGLVFAAASLGLMTTRRGARSSVGRVGLFAGACGAAVAATGTHEVTALALSMVSVTICASHFYTRHPGLRAWLIFTVVVLIGALIVVFAPGNFNRVRFFTESGDLLRTVQMAAWGTVTVLTPWTLDLKLWALSVLAMGMIAPAEGNPSWHGGSRIPWRWVVPVLTIMFTITIFLATGWGSGSVGPPRLHDQIYAVFLAGWMVTVRAWADRISPAVRGVCRGPGMLVAATILAAGLVSATNTTNAVHDFARNMAHDVAAWHAAVQRRYLLISNAVAAGHRNVRVPAPPMRPLSFANIDLTAIPGAAQNVCVARYFKLTSLALEANQ
ncbi:MAG: hypothetical protein COW30_01665 [Rhodospirillales bacterium CG15_BIG_FIL_POST_REV_8_21_14_020_66_15]|nr:MAG: hypothetical protein COW30_01665 [Rhodospirillales bacterium CG15_BIG_FIL_POST_REV_8_21_14_020_66_15]